MLVDYEVMFNNAMKVIKQQKEEIQILKNIIEGGKEFKVCPMCKKIKHETQFHRAGQGKRHCYCKVCKSEYMRKYKEKKQNEIQSNDA